MLHGEYNGNFIINNNLEHDTNIGVVFNNMTRNDIINLNNKGI